MENKEQKKQDVNSKGQNKYIPPKIKEVVKFEYVLLACSLTTGAPACGAPPFLNS